MPGPPLKLTSVELEQRLDDFVASYLQDKSPETIGTYRRALNEFQRWFVGQRPRFLFRVEDIEAYKQYLMKTRGLHQVSVSTYLTALRRFAQYLVDAGLLEENPARAVKGNRRPSTHSRAVLTESEIDRLFRAVDASHPIGIRDEAIIFAMLYAGLSEIEIVRADVEDLEQTLLGWYLRVQGKGHQVKDQQVVLDPQVMNKIKAYLDTRSRLKPSDPLFASHGHRSEGERLNTRSVRSRIRHHLMAAKIRRKGITPHSLTHTAALIWLNDGLSVEEVKQRMRHGTLDTTMIYLRKKGLLKRRGTEVDA
ncbi:MAG TPA: tyrosine-type recombinase/integrase [Rhodothermia bacterium]|nr:tyrosine-type recombinase/integrase [Rhodothermia bacterium]